MKALFDANSRNPRRTPIPGGKSVIAWLLLGLFCRESVMSFTVSFARIRNFTCLTRVRCSEPVSLRVDAGYVFMGTQDFLLFRLTFGVKRFYTYCTRNQL